MSKFNVGDKVYCPMLGGKVFELQKSLNSNYPLKVLFGSTITFQESGVLIEGNLIKSIFHATPENHELLSKLHSNVTFEAPPKSDHQKIADAVAAGKVVLCWVWSVEGDDKLPRQIKSLVEGGLKYQAENGCRWRYAKPASKADFTFLEDL